MRQVTLSIMLTLIGITFGFGQSMPAGYKVLPEEFNIHYKIHKKGTGKTKKVIINQFITFHVWVYNDRDSLIRTTYPSRPAIKEISTAEYKYADRGYMTEMLLKLSTGDSATFRMSADFLFSTIKRKRPKYLKPSDHIKYVIKVLNVQQHEEVLHDKEAKVFQQRQKDEKIISAYLKGKKFPTALKKTYAGVYYYFTKEGKGDFPVKGDVVMVKYKTMFLDGKVWRTSKMDGRVFDFPVGHKYVIPGFDQVLLLMREGTKGHFIMPSYLCYGENGFYGIPPHTILKFDIEFLAIKSRKQIIHRSKDAATKKKKKGGNPNARRRVVLTKKQAQLMNKRNGVGLTKKQQRMIDKNFNKTRGNRRKKNRK